MINIPLTLKCYKFVLASVLVLRMVRFDHIRFPCRPASRYPESWLCFTLWMVATSPDTDVDHTGVLVLGTSDSPTLGETTARMFGTVWVMLHKIY